MRVRVCVCTYVRTGVALPFSLSYVMLRNKAYPVGSDGGAGGVAAAADVSVPPGA